MTTRPLHDTVSIALDASHVLAAAKQDVHDKDFATRLDKRELAAFEANIAALQAGTGAQNDKLHSQVAAGVHAAEMRVPIVQLLRDARDDAKIAFPTNAPLQHAFGVGIIVNPASTSSVEHAGHALLATIAAHKKDAEAIHLNAKTTAHLSDLLHALENADVLHVQAASDRHSSTSSTDSLAHLVTAETAHLRLIAQRVFRDDEAKLARYASTLPRRQVKHRSKHAAPPETSVAASPSPTEPTTPTDS